MVYSFLTKKNPPEGMSLLTGMVIVVTDVERRLVYSIL